MIGPKDLPADLARTLRHLRDHRADPNRFTLDEVEAAVLEAWRLDVAAAAEQSGVAEQAVRSLCRYAARSIWWAITGGTGECSEAFRQDRLVTLLAQLPQ